MREDAGPGDREAVALETHLGEKCDVLFETVVMVDGFMRRIVTIRFDHRSDIPLQGRASSRHHIGCTQALAVLQVRSFDLVGGCCAAP
ncbi:hypothetical protein SDC9_114103 [bioreactor metagenome]|uniref:Uncharacterized protein n=1 Tax=bioreactor metagenome TaxID=1076179 RepID=A0A645BP83_9ZZZZ